MDIDTLPYATQAETCSNKVCFGIRPLMLVVVVEPFRFRFSLSLHGGVTTSLFQRKENVGVSVSLFLSLSLSVSLFQQPRLLMQDVDLPLQARPPFLLPFNPQPIKGRSVDEKSKPGSVDETREERTQEHPHQREKESQKRERNF